MIGRRKIFTVCLFVLSLTGADGTASDWSLRGYILEMPLLWEAAPLFGADDAWRFDSQVLARQNLRWYPGRQLTVAVEVNERLLIGESAQLMQTASEAYRFEQPYFDWRSTFIEEEDVVLEAEVDRFWVTAYHGDLEATLGRQRIAWGTTLVWNPTDLFNPTSPLDFANIENPGSDGLRVQYYLGPASRFEVAGALSEQEEDFTAAAQLVLNRWEYDWHFLGGRRAKEWVAGFAWAGHIKGGGFRGELLGLFPSEKNTLTEDPGLTAVLSVDYTFQSSLYLHGEALYNSRGITGDAGGFHLVQALRDNRLTPARWSTFAEVARRLHSLVYVSLAGILNPTDGSWYVGPTGTWNALTNLDVTLIGLIFGGDPGTEFGDNGTILLAQVWWSW